MGANNELESMLQKQVVARGIRNQAVLAALRAVPRERFIPKDFRHLAFDDRPVPIGYGQTISQPFIVAFMIDALRLKSTDKIFEVGTGCGYNAAVMSRIAKEVFSIERVPELGAIARETLGELGYENIQLRVGDGYKGWPEAGPFDAIVLTAAPVKLPDQFLDQLAEGGRLIAPEGDEEQILRLYQKKAGKIVRQDLIGVRFVPMIKES